MPQNETLWANSQMTPHFHNSFFKQKFGHSRGKRKLLERKSNQFDGKPNTGTKLTFLSLSAGELEPW